MVHGIAQGGRNVDELRTIWIETLQEGLHLAGGRWPRDLKVDFPYYGDALDQAVAQAALPTPADVVAKGPGQNDPFEQFMQSALAEMQAQGGIADAVVSASMEPGPGSQEKGIRNWRWVQALARVIDRRFTAASSFTIEAFLREVFVYIARPAVRRRIDAIVDAEVTTEPTVVIGHSLGSVVAYNVVRARRREVDVRRFITVGSPLGLRAISSRLGVVEHPAAKSGWFNAYDKRDIVALNPLDASNFPVAPAIVNHEKVDNSSDNRHGIIGYLDDRGVAAQVAAALA